ncbi:hypothetical protein GCM10011584_33550 [Nocardioides phosphati]|uniref:Uncharacterized protein n=1 Tax=Nocardioides phosphati TaxID=1867775 RepID=A0ABQ2NE75_9ACTN|nr:hypothetical protein [Nocardioides phosphati]GGO93864.1 hypothetical protein GCM10011584_33550 [Nocardioides phosphati]
MTSSKVRHDIVEGWRDETVDEVEEVGRFLASPFLAVAAIATYAAIQGANRVIHARDSWRDRHHRR